MKNTRTAGGAHGLKKVTGGNDFRGDRVLKMVRTRRWELK